MKHMLQICCKNNNIYKEFPIGSSLLDIYYGFNLNRELTFGYLLRF